MASIFFASNQGANFRANSAWVVGTVSAAAQDFELRVTNPTAGGNVPSKKDIILFLEELIYFLMSNQDSSTANYPKL